MLRRSSKQFSTRSLPPIASLISESWNGFTEHWKQTFLLSRWLILPGALILLTTLLERFGQTDLDILFPIIGIGMVLLSAWVTVGLIQHELGRVLIKKEAFPFTGGWQDIAAYIWTNLWHDIALVGMMLPLFLGLLGLAIVIAGTRLPEQLLAWLLFGCLILAVPLLWMTVSLAFWPFLLFDSSSESAWQRLRASSRFPSLQRTVALFVSSYELVRGRWWPVFIRFVIPGFVFGLLFFASVSVADFLIKLIAGPAKIEALFGKGLMGIDVNSSSRTGYSYFLQSLGLAAFFPLFIGWQAKLYKMLRKES